MFTRTEIKYMAGAGAYTKGMDLYAMDRVIKFAVEEDGDFDNITAQVRGSGRNIYEVVFTINKRDELLEYSDCQCPAFAEYSGLCKHCVAVLLEYNDYLDRKNTIDAYAQKQAASRDRLKNIQKGLKMETTPAIRGLLERQAVARSLPLIQEKIYGKIELEPHLTCNGDGAKLDFKIGMDKKYVLKDVFSFIDNLNAHENYKYGKNLQFIHTEDAFTEKSRGYVKFIKKWTEQNRDSYIQNTYYGYYYNEVQKVRYMQLEGRELEEFLLLNEGEFISADVGRLADKSWKVVREHLPRTLTITGGEQGIELKLQNFYSCGKANRYYIYFLDRRIYMEEAEAAAPVEDFIDCMGQLPGGKAFVETADIPAFCKELFPELEKVYKIRKVNFDPADYGLTPPEFKIYLDAPQDNMITCKPVARYGKKEYSIYTTEDILDVIWPGRPWCGKSSRAMETPTTP